MCALCLGPGLPSMKKHFNVGPLIYLTQFVCSMLGPWTPQQVGDCSQATQYSLKENVLILAVFSFGDFGNLDEFSLEILSYTRK